MKRPGLILSLLLQGLLLFAQKEYNNWYFGDYIGISFNTGVPAPLANGSLSTLEGCASISDSSGNLLFYTDGRTVYNRNHQIMLNGTGLLGGPSSTQSALIIKKPLCNRFYYIFTVAQFALTEGANYSIVDMNGDNGLGTITLKNQFLISPTAEKQTAIRHANGVDIWVLMHGWEDNYFYSFLLSKDGVSSSPVTTSIGTILKDKSWIGYLKGSPDGKILASAEFQHNYFELFRFDKTNGTLVSTITIGKFDTLELSGCYYGLEFSPDNKMLYTKTDGDSTIFQYRVSDFDSVLISTSKTPIGTINPKPGLIPFQVGAYQLAPDQKIYISRLDTRRSSCISFPNLQGSSCNFVDTAISFSNFNFGGLPNNPFTAPYIQQDGCFTGTYNFHLTDTTPYQRWDFGDPQVAGDTALQVNPSYTYTQPGVYTVSCIYLTDWQTFDTVITTVYAHPVPEVITADTLFSCRGASIQVLADSVYDTYTWNQGGSEHYIFVNQPGYYAVTVSEACGCVLRDSVLVILENDFSLGEDTLMCTGDTLVLQPEVSATEYLWNTGVTTPFVQIIAPGTYWLRLTRDACVRSDTIVVNPVYLSLDIGHDQKLCDGQDLELHATGDFSSMVWDNGSTFPDRLISESGWVRATAFKEHCSVSDSLYLQSCGTLYFPNSFTPNGDQHNDVFLPKYEWTDDYLLRIYNRWGFEVFRSHYPEKGWDGRNGGQDCPEGAYYYEATYRLLDQTGSHYEKASGTIILMR
jgi:gliding motility-associated-like protein